jgi:hypothetical protein
VSGALWELQAIVYGVDDHRISIRQPDSCIFFSRKNACFSNGIAASFKLVNCLRQIALSDDAAPAELTQKCEWKNEQHQTF